MTNYHQLLSLLPLKLQPQYPPSSTSSRHLSVFMTAEYCCLVPVVSKGIVAVCFRCNQHVEFQQEEQVAIRKEEPGKCK